MRREHVKARMLRAFSGKTQEQFGEEIEVHPTLVTNIELGSVLPDPHLQRMARSAGLTLLKAEEILRLYELLRQPQQGRARRPCAEGRIIELSEELRSYLLRAHSRLLMLPVPAEPPRPEDRLRADAQFERLKGLDRETRLAVVQVAEEFQTWSLCERYCEASIREASRDLQIAAEMAQLAQEIAAQVPGVPGWRSRIQGYAKAHGANVLKAVGELNAADAALEEAKRHWQAGTDPESILDPGRLLHFEAALRRAQRRFDEALARLDEAGALSYPERALISKGFTLEVMGEYERAIEVLLQAEPLVERHGAPRDRTVFLFNLASAFCNADRFNEAEDLVPQVRSLAAELGDEIDLIRLDWLEGRIAAGLGRRDEALRLLGQARQEFAARNMSYDVALALLEEAVLWLAEGWTAEVKRLAEELTKVFEFKGVHQEALSALRLFHEAAERDAATAELARRVLRFLLRARYDQGLRFTES